MFRILTFAALFGVAAAALADGPGSRLRAGPPAPQPAGRDTAPAERDAQRCEALRGDERSRCFRELRRAMNAPASAPHAGPGPESTGAGSGAGSGAGTGTSGGGSFGAAAPR